MALVIRLRQQGRTNRAFYRLVVTDSRYPRDGKYVEALGWYDPIATEDKALEMKPDRIQHWLDVGAQMSDRAEALIAKAAPAILRNATQKRLAHQAKLTAKRKARKKAAAA